MLQLKQFQLFHPIGGVNANESKPSARAVIIVNATINKLMNLFFMLQYFGKFLPKD